VKANVKAKQALILSMIVFGTVGLFVRGIALPSAEIALYRALLAAVTLLIYLRLKKESLKWQVIRHGLPLLLLSGLAMGLNWILLFEAYHYTTISVATLSYSFAPVLVTLLSPLLFKERMRRWQGICFGMAFLGLLFIIQPQGGEGDSHLLGVAFGLSAAMLYASVILLNKAIKGISGAHRTVLQFFAAILALVPYVLLTGGFHLSGLDQNGWALLMALGLVHTGIMYSLYFAAMQSLKGHEIALLSFIDPLVAVVCSVLFLGEPMSAAQAAGGALILGFTLLSDITMTRRPFAVPPLIYRMIKWLHIT